MASNRTRLAQGPMTAEEARRLPSGTDWARVAAMDDAELTRNAESDPDNLPIPEALAAASRRLRLEDFLPESKEKISLRLDRDVLEWFRAHGGRGYQTRINAALRAYIHDQDRQGGPTPSNT